MNIKQDIKNIINKCVDNLKNEGVFVFLKDDLLDFDIEYPEENFGDYSTNIAMKFARTLKKNPKEIAETIKKEILKNDKDKIFKRIEVAGPGFLNFYLNNDFISKKINKAKEEENNFGSNNFGEDKKVLVEFISANPTGDLHLGHGRGAFFGDVLGNILSFSGFDVTKEFYINDAKKSTQIQELGKTALGKGESYKTDKLVEKIKLLKDKLKDKKDSAEAGYLLAGELLKDLRDLIENNLKISFDSWFSEENELYKKGKVEEIYNFLKEKKLIYEKEGAEWLSLSDFGHKEDRVIVRSDEKKSPTYLLPDIAYHKNKIERGFDRLIDVLGADHQGHEKVVQAVMKLLGEKEKLDVFITQMVSLKDKGEKFKLSKRTGKIVTLKWLVDEVGLDATRFFYLTKSIDTQMEFDIALAKEQSDKNPVFYIQYAYARICSILRKAEKEGIVFDDISFELKENKQEKKLALELLKFPEVIKEISQVSNVQILPHYILGLARAFHSFYANCKVLGNENEDIDKQRLILIKTTKQTLKNALDLLGVSAPEKM